MCKGDIRFGIKEASAVCASAILYTLTDDTSDIQHMNLGIKNVISDYDKHTNTDEQTSECFHRPHYVHPHTHTVQSRYGSVNGFRNRTVLWIPKRKYKMRQRFKMNRILPNSLLTTILQWMLQNVRNWQNISKYTHTHTHTQTKNKSEVWTCGVMYIEYTCELWTWLVTDGAVRTAAILYGLYHRSPIRIIILCTSLDMLQTTICNFWHF